MNKLVLKDVDTFVNSNILIFHEKKTQLLKELQLKKILRRKNPYLFKAKNISLPQDLIQSFMEAYLSSTEEELFGDFLEELAIFIAGKTCNGRKSGAQGIDLEFEDNGIRYLVSIKSSFNWGNSSQQRKQEQDFKTAVKVLKQSNRLLNIQPVLGSCYGKVKTSFIRGYMKVAGQNFWCLISENKELYTEIIEPLGYNAKKHNDDFIKNRNKVITKLTGEFIRDFCDDDGGINWKRVVEFNSGNLDIEL